MLAWIFISDIDSPSHFIMHMNIYCTVLYFISRSFPTAPHSLILIIIMYIWTISLYIQNTIHATIRHYKLTLWISFTEMAKKAKPPIAYLCAVLGFCSCACPYGCRDRRLLLFCFTLNIYVRLNHTYAGMYTTYVRTPNYHLIIYT